MSTLANTYSDLNFHSEAQTLEEEVGGLHQRILGLEHPDTLASMSNLASTYTDPARHADVLKLQE
jgi:hypothetical protein